MPSSERCLPLRCWGLCGGVCYATSTKKARRIQEERKKRVRQLRDQMVAAATRVPRGEVLRDWFDRQPRLSWKLPQLWILGRRKYELYSSKRSDALLANSIHLNKDNRLLDLANGSGSQDIVYFNKYNPKHIDMIDATLTHHLICKKRIQENIMA